MNRNSLDNLQLYLGLGAVSCKTANRKQILFVHFYSKTWKAMNCSESLAYMWTMQG